MSSTPVGSNALILEVLDWSNYKHWRSRLKAYLLAEDLWEAVEVIVEPAILKDDQADYKAWTKKNAKALYAIQNSCGRELFSFISEIETAKGAWETLEQECKVVQGYDENNADHLVRYNSFIESVRSGDWDNAKNCLGEVDVLSVVVRAVAGNGEMALHVAAMEGHVHIVKELVQLMTQGEYFKIKTDFGFTALHVAAVMGHVHVVKELPVWLMGEVKDHNGDTALHTAVQEWQADIVKELVMLMRQEDLKIKNDAGNTALHIAVQKGQANIVKELVLLMRQEDLKIKNDDGYTALHLAVKKGNIPMVKEFVTKEEGENNIIEDEVDRYIAFTTYVANTDWVKAIECLRELDDPCNAIAARNPRNVGMTALHVVAWEGHVDVIKELLLLLKKRQEELELKTTGDLIAFGFGVDLEVSEVVMERARYMVEQYEKTLESILEIQNKYGKTALHLAAAKGNLDIVRELVPLMRKEGLEIKDDDGDTSLNIAVSQGHVDIAKELVQSMRQEGLEVKNNKGSNALHVAVMYGHMHIVKELMPLMRPETLEEKDGGGYTALGCALDVCKDGDLMEMANYMAEKNNKVFGIPAPPDDDIPIVKALQSSKWELARYLYSVTPLEVLSGSNGSALICYCLNTSKMIDLAWDLLQRYPNLAITIFERSKTSPMLRLARMRFAFLSGARLTRLQRWIYDRIHIREVTHVNNHAISINVAESIDDHDNKKGFISSVMTLFRRFGKGVLKFCGIHRIYEMKATHKWILEFLHCMGEATKMKTLTTEQLDMVKKSIFKAIEQGHFEFVTQLCKANPKLLLDTYDEKGRNIFHFAIEYRQKEVYSLIYGLKKEKRAEIAIHLVNSDNSLLHFAANLFSVSYFDHIQDASLEIQRELQWFKEVESIVPREIYEHRNRSDDLTARELFTKNHKRLIDDAKYSMKETANSCTFIGALIITMMFAAAFTLPGGNNGNTGLPLLLHNKLFKVFIVSDTISLVSSTTSVITFLGILTSRYAEDDFLKYLPTMMRIGIFTLFFSIATMMIAFSCALIIMLDGEAWIVIPSILFATVPAISFIWLLFPLLGEIFTSAYGPGLFDKRKRK